MKTNERPGGEAMNLGVVLLAAGRSERFGANKLLSNFGGRPMVCCALEAVKPLRASRVAVVASDARVMRLAGEYGCDVIVSDAPQLGQSHSIRLGVSAMRDMDAVLLLVCDQPLLSGASLCALLDAFSRSGKGIACLRDETHWGNPAVFSARYFDGLLSLEGDRGAKGLLRAHEDDLCVTPCLCAGELCDADTPEALESLKGRV